MTRHARNGYCRCGAPPPQLSSGPLGSENNYMLNLRKQYCADCHFFIEELPTPSGEPWTCEINTSARKEVREDEFSWMSGQSRLACSFGVWDERFDLARKDRHKLIVQTDRRNFCFWWRYHPGMLIPAAKILQEREAKQRESNRSRRLTTWGLWIASLALLANIWLTVAKEHKLWPF